MLAKRLISFAWSQVVWQAGLGVEQDKKRKRKQSAFLVEEPVESQAFPKLVEVLEELAKEGKYIDVQICPRCKSPKVRRVGTMIGDLWGHMGILPPKFECEECGWRARLVLNAANKPTSIKDAVIIAEALSLDGEKTRRTVECSSSILYAQAVLSQGTF
jgi:hypothetical protein